MRSMCAKFQVSTASLVGEIMLETEFRDLMARLVVVLPKISGCPEHDYLNFLIQCQNIYFLRYQASIHLAAKYYICSHTKSKSSLSLNGLQIVEGWPTIIFIIAIYSSLYNYWKCINLVVDTFIKNQIYQKMAYGQAYFHLPPARYGG